MARLAILSLLSVLAYVITFAFIIDRPLSIGLLGAELQDKSQALARLPSPKLVILAGSNGSYSHSCIILNAMLRLPCENAGTAVGLGLDEIFARFEPFLHRGDVVYMPMELQQYVMTRAADRSSVDDALLLKGNWRILRPLPPDRIIGVVFCCRLVDLLDGLGEMAITQTTGFRPTRLLAQEYNADGDRIDNLLSASVPDLLQRAPRAVPSSTAVARGYGTALISRFVARETGKGVLIIGGLPTDFENVELGTKLMRALRAVYFVSGGQFIALSNESHYPRQDFFNSEDHLGHACQLYHSTLIARQLAIVLRRPLYPLPHDLQEQTEKCPSHTRSDQPMSAAR